MHTVVHFHQSFLILWTVFAKIVIAVINKLLNWVHSWKREVQNDDSDMGLS